MGGGSLAGQGTVPCPAFLDKGLTDEQAKAIMKRVSGCDNASAFQLLTAKRQKEVLSTMLEKGVSVRQAARMTGVPKTTVARCSG